MEIFPYGDPHPLLTGKLGKLTPPPSPLENPIPSVGEGGGYGYYFSETAQSVKQGCYRKAITPNFRH